VHTYIHSLTHRLGLLAKSSEQQILAIFDKASELSMPFCRSMVQQIFKTDTVSTEHSSDGLSATILSAIKTALEKDQSSGLELLATLDSALTDKVSHDIVFGQNRIDKRRYDNMPKVRSSRHHPFSLRPRPICRAQARQHQHWSRSILRSLTSPQEGHLNPPIHPQCC